MDVSYLFYPILTLFLFFIGLKSLSNRYRKKLPPSPGLALPIIGHLYLIKPLLHHTLHKFSIKCGPVFSLRFGSRLVVVVSSPSTVEECFTKNDIVLANRPRVIIGQYVGYNYTNITFAPYGDRWRNLRKLAANEIFSPARLNMSLSIRQDDINHLIRNLFRISKSGYTKVDMQSKFAEIAFNIILGMTTGRRLFSEDNNSSAQEEGKRFRDLIRESFILSQTSYPGDFMPFLRTIDYMGYKKKVSILRDNMDVFLQGLIENRHSDHAKNNNTMMDHLLSFQEKQPDFYTDEMIKSNVLVMLLAGTDTTSVTLEWAMSNLLNNPQVLKHAKDEIESIVGNGRLIDESDLSRLPYLHNIILETFRLCPPAPLLVPHMSSGECKIGGYDVPGGTMVLVNAWAIHRDPKLWDDPESFKPERFKGTTQVDTTKLMPFGIGRRSCPGAGLALRIVGLTLGSLIQCFEWQRVGLELVDLTAGDGLTMPKAVPLEAKCMARSFVHNFLGEMTV